MHTVLDNSGTISIMQAMLDVAARIVEPNASEWMKAKLRAKPLGKKHITLHKHGDLWDKMWLAILAKGHHHGVEGQRAPRRSKMSRTDGRIRMEDKSGNDEADHVADLGVAQHSNGLGNLSQCYAHRHSGYNKSNGQNPDAPRPLGQEQQRKAGDAKRGEKTVWSHQQARHADSAPDDEAYTGSAYCTR